MAEQATEETAEQITSDLQVAPAPDERLDALEEENAALRRQVETLSAGREDADARERRLAEAKDENRKLRLQAADAILDQALRTAADTMEIDSKLVLGIYKSNFKTVWAPDGTLRVEPNPTEWLATKARSDPLLCRSVRAVRQRRADNSATAWGSSGQIDSLSDEQVLRLVEMFDRDPQAKSRFIAENPETSRGVPYLKLCARAQRLGYRRGNARKQD